MPVAQHHVHGAACRPRRHGVPVDQHRPPDARSRRLHHLRQGRVIGGMDPRHARLGLALAQASVVQRRPVSRQTRHHAVSGQSLGGGGRLVPVQDQRRIPLVRRAVQIDIGPAEPRGYQGGAVLWPTVDQLIHGGVLCAADGADGRDGPHVLRIDVPRMRRGEHQRRRAPGVGRNDPEGRLRRIHASPIACFARKGASGARALRLHRRFTRPA